MSIDNYKKNSSNLSDTEHASFIHEILGLKDLNKIEKYFYHECHHPQQT